MLRIIIVLGFLAALTLFCNALGLYPPAAAEYKKLLTDFITDLSQKNPTAELVAPAYYRLLNFANEHPNSRFADDAKYMLWMTEFMSSTALEKKDPLIFEVQIRRMEEFVKQYPRGRLEPLTIAVAHEIMGKQSFGLMLYVPYRYLIEYMRAVADFEMRDSAATVKLYASLKVELEGVIKKDNVLAAEIYYPLWGCLRDQQRFVEAKQLIEEVYRKYPGTPLEAGFRKIDVK